MRNYYTAETIRAAEAPLLASLPDGALMRRAAYGAATIIATELRARTGGVVGRRICAVVGSGDNGGDALWAATLLRRRGVAATAVLLNPEHTHAKALAAFRQSGGQIVSQVCAATDLVIDGVVGISGKGPLRPAAAQVFAAVDDAGIPVVAMDIPSGIDVHTGGITGPAVQAVRTVSFGGFKPVHALAECGQVDLIDIGLELPAADMVSFDAADVWQRWPLPASHDDKYTQGVTGIAAGSSTYPGAAVLCTGAAVAATSGMKRYAGAVAAEVIAHWPEVVAAPSVAAAGRVQAWVVGPGLGSDAAAVAVVNSVLATDLPVIVDADALTILSAHPQLVMERHAPTVLTPHAGEFVRLARAVGLTQWVKEIESDTVFTHSDQVFAQGDRVGAVCHVADAFGATVLLKGHVTVIADPGAGPVYLNRAGGSWSATAGSGDVLSGIIGALLAAGLAPIEAAAAAAFVHSKAAIAAAGSPGPVSVPISASRILDHIRCAVAHLDGCAVAHLDERGH